MKRNIYLTCYVINYILIISVVFIFKRNMLLAYLQTKVLENDIWGCIQSYTLQSYYKSCLFCVHPFPRSLIFYFFHVVINTESFSVPRRLVYSYLFPVCFKYFPTISFHAVQSSYPPDARCIKYSSVGSFTQNY